MFSSGTKIAFRELSCWSICILVMACMVSACYPKKEKDVIFTRQVVAYSDAYLVEVYNESTNFYLFTVLTDPETGCQYFYRSSADLEPRMRPDGKQVCIPVKPLSSTD